MTGNRNQQEEGEPAPALLARNVNAILIDPDPPAIDTALPKQVVDTTLPPPLVAPALGHPEDVLPIPNQNVTSVAVHHQPLRLQ